MIVNNNNTVGQMMVIDAGGQEGTNEINRLCIYGQI